MVYNARNLDPVPGATFDSLMRPKDDEWDKIEEGALKVNGIKIPDLQKAPDRDAVWGQFVTFVNRFRNNKTVWGAPIPAGQNIKNFDLIIIERLCKEHGQIDREGRANIFNRRHQIDLLDIMWLWYENQKEPARYNFDTLRDYFGLTKEGAHSSKVDVAQTGDLIMRFIRMHRKMFSRVPGLKGVAAAAA
jgi:DNA polymerase III epsilon subunit-like protein